jgi:hypothetical protein
VGPGPRGCHLDATLGSPETRQTAMVGSGGEEAGLRDLACWNQRIQADSKLAAPPSVGCRSRWYNDGRRRRTGSNGASMNYSERGRKEASRRFACSPWAREVGRRERGRSRLSESTPASTVGVEEDGVVGDDWCAHGRRRRCWRMEPDGDAWARAACRRRGRLCARRWSREVMGKGRRRGRAKGL